MIAGSSQNIATPAAPTVTVRTAGSNETALTGVTTNISVKISALNYFGETTVSSSSGNIAWSSGQVADVSWTLPAGAQQVNIYIATSSGSTWYLQVGTTTQSSVTYTGAQSANSVGGVKFTLQGAIATSSNQTPPATDTGTGGSNRMEGLIPTLSGLSSTGAGPYSNVGFETSGVWKGGYVNSNVGTHLSTNAIFTALDSLWENNGMNNVTPGVYRADPSEIVADGGDLMRLANDILSQGAGLNYLLSISQDQISGVRAGAAVAEFVNPVTRSTLKLTVHPWMSQGTALLMSYQLPQTWSHVDNAWEMTCVQDYVNLAPRQGDLPMGSALPGECRRLRQIPVTSDALRCVETVRAGSVSRTLLRGIAQRGPAEQETVRSCVDGKPQEDGRNDRPARCLMVARGNRMQRCLASDRRNVPLLHLPSRHTCRTCPILLGHPAGSAGQRRDSLFVGVYAASSDSLDGRQETTVSPGG